MILKSKLDQSVNFVTPCSVGFMEARYVRRVQDYFTCYLSCQSGCNQGCRFCHLTTTKQTDLVNLDRSQILAQAKEVLDHYDTCEPAKYVSFSFMARGEPLLSGLDAELIAELNNLALWHWLLPRVVISTIMPKSLHSLAYLVPAQPTLYYSLYSVNPKFRARWLPKAMDPFAALEMLREYQLATNKLVRIHFALIDGENDSAEEIADLIEAVQDSKLRVDFNLVRYNAAPKRGRESTRYLKVKEQLEEGFPESRVKVISRVGEDVHASCGMFPTGEDLEVRS